MNKNIEFGSEARKKVIKGINKLADAVSSTLGPNGRNIIYTEFGEVRSTKDGVTVAKQISNLEDPMENMGAEMIKQTAIKTANSAGDGTTTSTLLAQKIINEGLEYIDKGANAVDIKRGIDEAVKEVVNYLKKNISQDISSENQLEQIATISANNDPEVGKLIATAIEKVGREGVVTIEESKTGETYLETVEGIQFDRGYKSHYFVTNNNDMSCTLEDPYILIADRKFNQVKDLLPILESVSSTGKSLLVIAEDIDGEALSTLIVNKMRGTLKIAAVKAPDFGDRRKLLLEDMAIMTGGQVFSSDKGMKLDKFDWGWFGKARLVTITKDQTTIIDGKGDENKISERISEFQVQIEKSTVPFEKEKLQERLSKFIGGVAIIHVGGNSEIEMKEKKDRVDDALHAAKAAIEEGILPGGGVALIYARRSIYENNKNLIGDIGIGKNIIYKVCSSPFRKILENAGYNDEKSFELINKMYSDKECWKGYNIKTEEFVDMKEAGILDPTKVTRNALENAASIAGTILLTEAVIVEINDKKEQTNPGMGEMY
jgi:chaperonin GroEL